MPTFFDLMGGIGGIRLGLERAGWKCMGYCEIDKYSRRTYYANFGGADEFDWEDARTLPVDKIPDFDMLASGFPCQPWSTAGKREAFEDARGTLFFEIARLLQARRPPCFLLENVKGLLSEPMRPSFNRMLSILRGLGYAVSVRVLNSRDYGVPQNRERVFFAGFRTRSFQEAEFPWPAPNPTKASLSDILEPDPDPKYNLSEKLVKGLLGHLARNRLSGKGPGWGITLLSQDSDYAPPISESYWRGPGGAGGPGVVSPPVMDNFARGMTAVQMVFDSKNSYPISNSKDEMRSLITREGLGVAVNSTNPHWKGDTREYHAGQEMRTLSAESSGTNAPLVVQIKRYAASGDHTIREYETETPTLTEQMGKGGDNVPLVVRASSAASQVGRERVRLVREDMPSLMSGGETGWAGYGNALAVGLKGGERIEVSETMSPVTAAGSRSQLAAVRGMRIRRLTPRECARLQGFPETFLLPCSDHRLYMQFGNTVTVPVIEAIGRAMLERFRKPNL